jgi:hypothetical protein
VKQSEILNLCIKLKLAQSVNDHSLSSWREKKSAAAIEDMVDFEVISLSPGASEGAAPGGVAQKDVLDANVLIQIRPVNPLSTTDEPPSGAFPSAPMQ